MYSESFHANSVEQLSAMLKDSNRIKFQPTLAIVFTSVKHDIDAIRQVFDDNNIDLVGCTTAGEIVNTDLHEESIAVLLFDMNPSCYYIQYISYGENLYKSAAEIGKEAKEAFANPGLLLMSGGLAIDAQELIDGLGSTLSKGTPIYGGLAGDDLVMERTHAFTRHEHTTHGVAVLGIDTDRITMTGLAISGWEPLGGVNVITKAVGNVVYEINNEPAFEVFSRYFGVSDTGSKYDQLITIQTNYPFQIIREENHTILRSPLLVNAEEGTITLAARVEEGTQFRFSTSPGFEVIEQTVEEFSQLHRDVPEADAMVLFSCKGRHGAFGPMLNDEVEGIYNYWKKPMVGFLSYGEIGNKTDGSCEFHNETCVLALLKEK